MTYENNRSFVPRYQIRHIIELVALVAMVLVVLNQQQAIRDAEKETQHLIETLTFETTVPIQYGNYQLFRLKDGRIIAVTIEIPDSDSEGNSGSECLSYRWAMAENFKSDEAAIGELIDSFRTLTDSPDVEAGGRGELCESSGDRLVAGPLSIAWSSRSANSGWLSLSDAYGATFFMYTEQPESLKDIQLSPFQWRPIYWVSGPVLHGGWDHYLVPSDLITEWEESKANEPYESNTP